MISSKPISDGEVSSEKARGKEAGEEARNELWNRPNAPTGEGVSEGTGGSNGDPARSSCFYINADLSRGWPYHSEVALCKLGVTSKPPAVRCRENEEALRRKWGIEANLAVVFVATGRITTAEKEIVDYTLPWLPGSFQKNAEWRLCPPRELARIAVLIAEERFRSGLS
jgi:hypothetical protein